MDLNEIKDKIGIKPYFETELGVLYNADCLDVMAKMPDKCVDMVLADPPYFEIKGDFDFAWDNFDLYLVDVHKWAINLKKLLCENGTLFWFGDEKRIAYTQIIFDKYFVLLNSLVWEKAERDGLFGSTGSKLLRSFPVSTERILMYSNDVYNLTQCVYSIRDYIRAEITRAKGKIVLKDINMALGTASNGGGVASACLSLKKAEPVMFTKEMYNKLRIWLNNGREYEYLRREYEYFRRPFNNKYNLTEVLEFNSDTLHKFEHETVKPVVLISRLIQTCSKENDIILDPFLGSGTTAVACKELGRNYIGIEISPEYCAIAEKRLAQGVLNI